MLKIGDFSRLSRVTVKTLHHYDELGLLKPAHVDPWTGYRYYAADQLTRLNRILALKDLGFALDQIEQMLHADLTAAQLRQMLERKRIELEQRVQDEQARLLRIAARLSLIEQEGTMPEYDVVVKEVEPCLIVAGHSRITGDGHRLVERDGAVFAEGDLVDLIGQHCRRMSNAVCAFLPHSGLRESGPWLLIYDQDDAAIVLEMGLIVDGTPKRRTGDQGVIVRELQGHERVASVIHRGGYETIQHAYVALGRWIETNGYQLAGAIHEMYLRGPTDPVTEIQFPIKRT